MPGRHVAGNPGIKADVTALIKRAETPGHPPPAGRRDAPGATKGRCAASPLLMAVIHSLAAVQLPTARAGGG